MPLLTPLQCDVMKDSSALGKTVKRARGPQTGVRSSTSLKDFDWDYFIQRTSELGAATPEDRAKRARISMSTYYRLQRNEANLTVRRLTEIALQLGIDRKLLLPSTTSEVAA